MEHHPDLEVDVNGEEVFRVDKEILASFSGRLNSLFTSMRGISTTSKVIFHDFPGGARGFELIARYCYSYGKIQTTPHQSVLLNRAANYMQIQMKKSGKSSVTLIPQTEKSLQGIGVWRWPELLLALKSYQVLPLDTDLQCIINKLLESLAERITPSCSSTPKSSSSSERPSVQSTISLDSSVDSYCQTTWWFEDIVFLNIEWIKELIEIMKSKNFNHVTIWKFLLFYQRSRFQGAEPAERCEVAESVINLLSTLEKGVTVSCKSLFDALRMSSNLKLSKQCKNRLESLIGSCLDQATLDDLLIPSSNETKDYIYDVNLVQRLLKYFLLEGNNFTSSKLKAVSRLMDSYAMEIAPVASLKPSKFAAILMTLPDSARDCHDDIYQFRPLIFIFRFTVEYGKKRR